MAAPTLQAEGGLSVTTSSSNSPTIPTHQADDILVLAMGIWFPNNVTFTQGGPTDSGTWSLLGSVTVNDGIFDDGIITYWWKRATGAGTTVTVTHDGDSGADTAFGCRVYVIRGCITSGDPFDEAVVSLARTTANQSCAGLTVSGAERLAIQFLVKTDDFSTAPTLTDYTAGAQVESTTGQDHSQGSFRQDNASSSITPKTSTVEAPAAGFYVFCGVSFKPPATARVPYSTSYPQLLAH